MREQVSIDEVVELLNRALFTDGPAISGLCGTRIKCNLGLALHETIQVSDLGDGKYEIGMLGILNGLFGTRGDGWGPICAIVESETQKGDIPAVLRFERTPEKGRRIQT